MKTRKPTKSQFSQRARSAYWGVVEDCLVQLHHLDEQDARARWRKLRKRLEQSPKGIDSDLIYHADPFDVACDLVGKVLDHVRHRSQYERIVRDRGW